MNKKTMKLLWGITALVALILFGVTIGLGVKANTQDDPANQSVRAYLQSDHPLIIILTEPEYRSIVASIQQSGTPIVVTEYLRRSGEDWYQVDINEMESGWVQGRYISLERP